MKHKSEVPAKFKEFQAVTQNYCRNKIGTLRSDRGGEYQSEDFEEYLKKEGIKHEMSVARCPEQNGVAERINHTLVESARAMIAHAGLPNCFWAEAVATAAYLRNRLPTSTFKNKITPYEKWYETKPNLSHLKVFGSVAYAHIPDQERKKLDQKAEKLRFVGYSLQSKGYRLYDDTTHKIKIRRNVTFNESDYKLKKDVALQKENVTKQTVDIILEENENEDDC